MYRERPAALPGAVIWQGVTSTGTTSRVLPDGCIDLIWDGTTLEAVGPDRQARVVTDALGAERHAVRFAPGQAPGLLGVPASALVDIQVPLAELWGPAQVAPIEDRLAASSEPETVLDELAVTVAERGRSPDVELLSIRRIVTASRWGTTVRAMAAELGVSERQLRRISHRAFGYGPKTLGRILRLQRALALARSGHPLAQVAAEVGYADQQHLARETRALAGATPTELVS